MPARRFRLARVAVTAAAGAAGAAVGGVAASASAIDASAGDQAWEVGDDGVCLPLRRGFARKEGRCGEHTAGGTGCAWKGAAPSMVETLMGLFYRFIHVISI